jgi:hypothetical protein
MKDHRRTYPKKDTSIGAKKQSHPPAQTPPGSLGLNSPENSISRRRFLGQTARFCCQAGLTAMFFKHFGAVAAFAGSGPETHESGLTCCKTRAVHMPAGEVRMELGSSKRISSRDTSSFTSPGNLPSGPMPSGIS